MYVCICHGVTDQAIRQAAQDGVRRLKDLQMATGCAGGCGRCAETAETILREAHAERTAAPFPVPLLA